MMAKAIGPQKTVGAIGIMPSTVDSAVSISGRKRELLAATSASQTVMPSARSDSICTSRMTPVLGDHPEQREDAEDRDEAERLAEQQQRRDHADQAERQGGDHQAEPAGSSATGPSAR